MFCFGVNDNIQKIVPKLLFLELCILEIGLLYRLVPVWFFHPSYHASPEGPFNQRRLLPSIV
ncbi:hypothetical protein HanIR_Chr06g0297351 [Helianthus annuus]|nr:hypothetical protein HanIR_Chr06g0297351 [Helianthus annuus]